MVVTSSPMYALRAAASRMNNRGMWVHSAAPTKLAIVAYPASTLPLGRRPVEGHNVRSHGENTRRGNVPTLQTFEPAPERHATLTALACIAGTTSFSSGISLVRRSSASSGARYGGRAGPIWMPVVTVAHTLVIP